MADLKTAKVQVLESGKSGADLPSSGLNEKRRTLPPVVEVWERSSISKKDYDINEDGKPDLGHPEVVSAFYKEAGFEVTNLHNDKDGFAKHAKRLLELKAQGKALPAAVNLSQAYYIDYEQLSELAGAKGISPQNVIQYRDQINNRLAEMNVSREENPVLYHLKNQIPLLSELAESGVKVFVGAGNSPGRVNGLALAKGVYVVESEDDITGKQSYFSEHTSLATHRGLGEYVVERLPTGIDVTGNGIADFTYSELGMSEEQERYGLTEKEASFLEQYVGKEVEGLEFNKIPQDVLDAAEKFLVSDQSGEAYKKGEYVDEHLPFGIYDLSEYLKNVHGVEPPKEFIGPQKQYIFFGEDLDTESKLEAFSPSKRRVITLVEREGKLTYDRMMNKDTFVLEKVDFMNGTSFSTPAAAVKILSGEK